VVYVKKAYLQATISPALQVRVGSADLPWVPFVENIYGYRFVENTLIDRTKYGTSADWGVHVAGTVGGGLLSYAVSAVNGAGYKTLSRHSDTIDIEGRLSLQPVKHIVLAVGGYTGKLGKSAADQPATPHRATRFDALAAWVGGPVRVGIEYFSAKNWKNVTTAAHDRTSGWSAFGSYAFAPKFTAFGRYDRVNPDKDSNPALDDAYFNVGLDYALAKDIDLALVYKRERAENGLIATSNGTIGGTDRGRYDEIGLWAQVKF
jgi:predicted porin